ncbi:MAG: hypothetical protein GX070_04730 [Alcaligenaceae bacterium]|nr:hypothetical protein [Alcaligenaceae bacterium]
MSFPSFFDQAPTISLRDPLAGFLGAAHNGVIQYTYTDVVKLAGHSCPTVAGAYLMTFKAAVVPAAPGMMPALFDALEETASPEQKQAFATAWQDRVRQIFENANHPELVVFK